MFHCFVVLIQLRIEIVVGGAVWDEDYGSLLLDAIGTGIILKLALGIWVAVGITVTEMVAMGTDIRPHAALLEWRMLDLEAGQTYGKR